MRQAVILDVGGEIEAEFPTVRPASVTVSVYNEAGTAKVSAASGTVDPVSTTTSAAVAAGATTVALADASSIVAGRRYAIGVTGSYLMQEVVTVRDLSASVATLTDPVVYQHASGDAFRGVRVSYTVSAAAANALWWDGYAVWTPNTGAPVTEGVDCVKRMIPEALLNVSDCLMVYPKGKKMLDLELNLPRALRDARDKFLRDLGGRARAHSMLSSSDLKWGAALCFWLMRDPSMGEAWLDMADKWQELYNHEIEKLRSQVPTDNEQDGVTDGPSDGGVTSGRVERA